MNPIIKNLVQSKENETTIVGALENALASAINRADETGGWSVKIDLQNKEISLTQHPDAGDEEYFIEFEY